MLTPRRGTLQELQQPSVRRRSIVSTELRLRPSGASFVAASWSALGLWGMTCVRALWVRVVMASATSERRIGPLRLRLASPTLFVQHVVLAGVMADAAMVDAAIELDVYAREADTARPAGGFGARGG